MAHNQSTQLCLSEHTGCCILNKILLQSFQYGHTDYLCATINFLLNHCYGHIHYKCISKWGNVELTDFPLQFSSRPKRMVLSWTGVDSSLMMDNLFCSNTINFITPLSPFSYCTRWFKYDRDWFVCKQAALRSSCATLREWSHNLHPPSCSG